MHNPDILSHRRVIGNPVRTRMLRKLEKRRESREWAEYCDRLACRQEVLDRMIAKNTATFNQVIESLGAGTRNGF